MTIFFPYTNDPGPGSSQILAATLKLQGGLSSASGDMFSLPNTITGDTFLMRLALRDFEVSYGGPGEDNMVPEKTKHIARSLSPKTHAVFCGTSETSLQL